MAKTLFLLFEHASGFALFERVENEEIAVETEAVENSVVKKATFLKMVKFIAFYPFTSAENALDNIKCISEGLITDFLIEFLDSNLPKVKKIEKAKFHLGLDDFKMASAIQESCKIPCVSNDIVRELLRGIRLHFHNFIEGLLKNEIITAQLGLSHNYSQHKVRYSLKREDNMVIQSICLLDTVDKDLNNFYMKIREWYGWHFPELKDFVKDPKKYAETALVLSDKSSIKKNIESVTEKLCQILGDIEKAKSVLKAAEFSVGFDVEKVDEINFKLLANRYLSLFSYRDTLHNYLLKKMTSCAPNLTAVIGEMVGARLISHAGGLLKLAKCPASTVQVLGAEKALFRALKMRSRTPKYGLIFHSKFITKAAIKNKGRVSRFLANKCAIASRIDSFSENPTDAFGKILHQQLEEKLEFLATGKIPKQNSAAMIEAFALHKKALSQQKIIKSEQQNDKINEKIDKKDKINEKIDKKDKNDENDEKIVKKEEKLEIKEEKKEKKIGKKRKKKNDKKIDKKAKNDENNEKIVKKDQNNEKIAKNDEKMKIKKEKKIGKEKKAKKDKKAKKEKLKTKKTKKAKTTKKSKKAK